MLPAERERVAPPSRAALAALGLTTLAALAATGCLTPWGARPRPHCPIELVPSDALSEGAAWRARIELSSGADEPRAIRGEVAARVEGGVLRLAALTPFGTRAFTIVQRGTQPTVDDLLGRRLGLEPLWILDAFHRLHALEALDARPAPPVGGPVVWSHGGERIEESAVATGLRRRFADASAGRGHADGTHWRAEALRGPRRSEIRNDWCGYRIAWLGLAPPGATPANAAPER